MAAQSLLKGTSCSLLMRQVHSSVVTAANGNLMSLGSVLNSNANSVYSISEMTLSSQGCSKGQVWGKSCILQRIPSTTLTADLKLDFCPSMNSLKEMPHLAPSTFEPRASNVFFLPEEHGLINVAQYFSSLPCMIGRSTNTDMLQQAFYWLCRITVTETIYQQELPHNLTLTKFPAQEKMCDRSICSLPRQNSEYLMFSHSKKNPIVLVPVCWNI